VGQGWIQQNRAGTRCVELVFLHLVGSTGHVVHSDASGVRNVYTLFFMIGWDQFGFNKKCTGRHNTELVILHPVRSAGHVVHFDSSGAQNVDALVFMFRWDRYRF
jgi:hypothetical protein